MSCFARVKGVGLLIPDTHEPHSDRKARRAVLELARDLKPAWVVHLGDLVDFPSLSRWNRGFREEHSLSAQEGVESGRAFLSDLRAAVGPSCPISWKVGNHDRRLETYLRTHAPGLSSLDCLGLPELFKVGEVGVRVREGVFRLPGGWLAAHGDEGRSSQVAGMTALGLARKTGRSVACGHVHRAGLVPETTGYGSRNSRTLYGLECGHLMDLSTAEYLQLGHANWQHGCGVLWLTGREGHTKALPQLVVIDNGTVSLVKDW